MDLKAYYHRNGPYFWSLFTAAAGWPLATDTVASFTTGGALEFLSSRLGDLGALAVFGSLIFVRKLWWHALAMLLLSAGVVGWLSRSLG